MRIGIFGAGLIGCHVGGMLAAAGEDVVLVGRPAMAERIAHGLTVSRYDGLTREVGPDRFVFSTEAAALAERDMVFICVKGADTERAGMALAGVIGPQATVVSLQNGVSNAERLRRALPRHRVLAAMVPFNVSLVGSNRFHCGSEGTIIVEAGGPAAAIASRLTEAGMGALTSDRIEPVLWAKLLMNLNNGVNALSGLPLKAQLSGRDYRLALALCVAEALTVLKAAGIRPARIGKVWPPMIPFLLRLPDRLFAIAAAGILKIDDEARSSMAEDLAAGRPPEIDFLNGEIVRLGQKTGVPTPVNARMVELVTAAFAAGALPRLSGSELLAALRG